MFEAKSKKRGSLLRNAYQFFKVWSIILLGIMLVGCAPTRASLYQSWGKQLAEEMPNRNGRVEDVSMLLGVPQVCYGRFINKLLWEGRLK